MADPIGPPPIAVPMYLADGRMDPQWIAWFHKLWQLVQ
jgi:hypothetical protein